MLDPICAVLVTAARNPMVETGVGAVGLACPEVLDPGVLEPLGPGRDARRGRRGSPTVVPSFIVGSSHGMCALRCLHIPSRWLRQPRPFIIEGTLYHVDCDHRRPPCPGPDRLGLPRQAHAAGPPAALLETETESLPSFWTDLASLGWLGLHLPEDKGGSGFGLPELVVVTEELPPPVTPGPFVPTVIASAVIDAAGLRCAGGAPRCPGWPTARSSGRSC